MKIVVKNVDMFGLNGRVKLPPLTVTRAMAPATNKSAFHFRHLKNCWGNNMEQIDLTNFSDRELSLQVFNDEALYNIRKKEWFLEFIKERFAYTQIQYWTLVRDLAEEEE